MVYIYIIRVYYSKTRMSKHRTICARTKAAAAYYLGYRIPHLLRLVRIPSWNSAILQQSMIFEVENNAKWIPNCNLNNCNCMNNVVFGPSKFFGQLSNSSNIYHHEKITVSLSGHTPLASECQCHAFAPGEKITLNWWVSARWCLITLHHWD